MWLWYIGSLHANLVREKLKAKPFEGFVHLPAPLTVSYGLSMLSGGYVDMADMVGLGGLVFQTWKPVQVWQAGVDMSLPSFSTVRHKENGNPAEARVCHWKPCGHCMVSRHLATYLHCHVAHINPHNMH